MYQHRPVITHRPPTFFCSLPTKLSVKRRYYLPTIRPPKPPRNLSYCALVVFKEAVIYDAVYSQISLLCHLPGPSKSGIVARVRKNGFICSSYLSVLCSQESSAGASCLLSFSPSPLHPPPLPTTSAHLHPVASRPHPTLPLSPGQRPPPPTLPASTLPVYVLGSIPTNCDVPHYHTV